MAQNETWLTHDLMNPVKVQYLAGNLFSMDNAGNLIGVTITKDGVAYSGGGSVSANVIRADGGTVTVSGALSGNVATVVLPQAAYAVPGVASIVVKLTVNGEITTVAAVVANVYESSTDTAIDPGTIIPSIQTLIDQIDTTVASIPADYYSLWTSLAPAFSTSTAYTAGQYVTYNGGLYRFITDHAAGSWSSSDVSSAKLGNDIADLKSALTNSGLLSVPIYTELDGVINTSGSVIGSSPNVHTSDIAVKWGDVLFVDVYSYSGFALLARNNGSTYTSLKPCTTNGQQTFVYKVTENMNVSIPYQNNKPFTVKILSDIDYLESSALLPSMVGFDTIGNANALPANRSYLVYGHDVVSGSNLPSGLSVELDAYPAVITTIASTISRGYQVIISTNNIFFRTVTISSGIVNNGSTWRTVDNNTVANNYLRSANDVFSTIGNANALPANKTYLVYGHDVVSGANLPDGLASELDAWPAAITTIEATASRGYQLITSTNNIFFRTVTISAGTVASGSTWRTVDNNQTAKNTIAKMIDDATEQVPPYADYENFYSTANGSFLAKALTTDSIDVTPSNIYGVHESGIYVYNNKMYLVCGANKTDTSEDQTKYNLELVKTALDGTIESSTKIVAVGDVIGSDEVTKCQAAFMLPVGGTIHIYCDVSISTGYKLYHLTYDTGTGEFSSFDEVYYVNKSGQTVKAEKNGEQYIASSWFSYSTHDYCTALYFNAQNAGIGYTDDFTTFKFIAFLEDGSLVGAGGEMSAVYVSGFNKIVLVHRTKNDWSFLNMYQYDLTSSKWEPVKYIPDATARPMFFTYSGGIYLANNSPYSRQNVTIWKYLTSADGIWSNKGIIKPVSVAKLSTPCTYFAFCVYNNEIYMSSIQNNLTKIKVSKIPLETVSNSDVNAKMIELFGT